MTQLPAGWEEVPLASICARLVDGSHNPPKAATSGKPMLSARNIFDHRIVLDDYRLIGDSDFEREDARTRVCPGDILLTIVGTIGRAAVVPAGFQPICLQRSVAVLKTLHVNSQYLAYAVEAPKIQRWLTESAKGTAQKGVYLGTLGTAKVPLAPEREQTRIVEKLEELLSDLDAGVAELKAAQAKLAQYRQSLLKAAVEGALTAEWRKHNKPKETGAQLLKRILTERRARWEAKQLAKFKEQGKAPPKDWKEKYPEASIPDCTGLSDLPAGWVWASVEQLGEVQLGRQRSPNKVGGADPTPYIRAANITEAGIDFADVLKMDFSETEKETFALKPADILLTEASGSPQHVGRPAIWPDVPGLYCFQNTVIRFSPRGIGTAYAFCLFLAMQKLGVFQKLSGGVGINHLSAGKFSKLACPLPPTDEQVAIVDAVTTALASCDDQWKLIHHSLHQSAAQRTNILKTAFSGQLVAQDPTDEPASELLARIRAAREDGAKPAQPRAARKPHARPPVPARRTAKARPAP